MLFFFFSSSFSSKNMYFRQYISGTSTYLLPSLPSLILYVYLLMIRESEMSGCSTPIFTICAFFTIKRKKVGMSLNISAKWREKKKSGTIISTVWMHMKTMNLEEKPKKSFYYTVLFPLIPLQLKPRRTLPLE